MPTQGVAIPPYGESAEEPQRGATGWMDATGSTAPRSFAGRGPHGYVRSDERLREDVCERLTAHPAIDASEIDVIVQDGEVTLAGTVPDRRMKHMAEDIAADVRGVVDVLNHLRVVSA